MIRCNQLRIGGENGSISFNSLSDKPYIPLTAQEIGAVANNQAAVFNALTDYGSKKGLYMAAGGELYINADYIKTGTLVADRMRNSLGYNSYASVGGSYGDLDLYHDGVQFFSIYNGLDYVALQRNGDSKIVFGSGGSSLLGSWDLSKANISGLQVVAKFA